MALRAKKSTKSDRLGGFTGSDPTLVTLLVLIDSVVCHSRDRCALRTGKVSGHVRECAFALGVGWAVEPKACGSFFLSIECGRHLAACVDVPAKNSLDSTSKPALPQPVWLAHDCRCSQPAWRRKAACASHACTNFDNRTNRKTLFYMTFIRWLKFSHVDSRATAMRLAHCHPNVIHRVIHRLCG